MNPEEVSKRGLFKRISNSISDIRALAIVFTLNSDIRKKEDLAKYRSNNFAIMVQGILLSCFVLLQRLFAPDFFAMDEAFLLLLVFSVTYFFEALFSLKFSSLQSRRFVQGFLFYPIRFFCALYFMTNFPFELNAFGDFIPLIGDLFNLIPPLLFLLFWALYTGFSLLVILYLIWMCLELTFQPDFLNYTQTGSSLTPSQTPTFTTDRKTLSNAFGFSKSKESSKSLIESKTFRDCKFSVLDSELEISRNTDNGTKTYLFRSGYEVEFGRVCKVLNILDLQSQINLLSELIQTGLVRGFIFTPKKEPKPELQVVFDPDSQAKIAPCDYFVPEERGALLSILEQLKEMIYSLTAEIKYEDPFILHFLDLATQLAIPFLPSEENSDYIVGLGRVMVQDGHLLSLSMDAYNIPDQCRKSVIGGFSEPDDWFYYVPRLDFLFNEIGEFSHLRKLHLRRNEITRLPPSIGKLQQLEFLDLSYNRLTSLPLELFSLPHLSSLYVRHNRLTSLPLEINKCLSLCTLSLEQNYIIELSEPFLQFFKGFRSEDFCYCHFDSELISLDIPLLEKRALAELGASSRLRHCVSCEDGHVIKLELVDIHFKDRISEIPPSIKHLTHLRILDLRRNILTELPVEIGELPHLRELDLSDNKLSTLPDSIGNLRSLQRLRLADNRLISIPESIGKLRQLEILDLGSVRIPKYPSPTQVESEETLNEWVKQGIDRHLALALLETHNNKLTVLPETLGHLTNLIELNLEGNCLESLPEFLGNLGALKRLNLANNFLKEFPRVLLNLIQLVELYLGSPFHTFLRSPLSEDLEISKWFEVLQENMAYISDWVWPNLSDDQGSKTSSLFLSSVLDKKYQELLDSRSYERWDLEHKLRRLPRLQYDTLIALEKLLGKELIEVPEFKRYQTSIVLKDDQLIGLTICNETLHSLPKNLGNFIHLTHLSLHKIEGLTSLPESIGNMQELTFLSICGMKLTSFPQCIGNLNSLIDLDISDNHLIYLPNTISQLKKLESLTVNNNLLSHIPEWIGQLISLKELTCKRCELSDLSENISELSNLTTLNLAVNKLTSLPDNFGNLSNLESLVLEYNKLNVLPSNFGWLSQLKNLNLNGNLLSSLPKSMEQLTQLEGLKLDMNQFISLPDWIGKLPNLYKLSIIDNRLTSLPLSLINLPNLRYLDVMRNNLSNNQNSLDLLQNLKDKGIDAYR